jgi:hypothetical protein
LEFITPELEVKRSVQRFGYATSIQKQKMRRYAGAIEGRKNLRRVFDQSPGPRLASWRREPALGRFCHNQPLRNKKYLEIKKINSINIPVECPSGGNASYLPQKSNNT